MFKQNYWPIKIGLVAALVVCVLALGCQQQQADATVAGQAARTIMIQNVEVYNTGNTRLAEAIIAPDYVGHYSARPEAVLGLENFKEWVKTNRAAYSDFMVGIDDIIVEENMVCLQWTVTGTNDGPRGDLPPTGKRILIKGLTLARLVDGKIAEEWITWDMLDMNRQLGFTVVPPEA